MTGTRGILHLSLPGGAPLPASVANVSAGRGDGGFSPSGHRPSARASASISSTNSVIRERIREGRLTIEEVRQSKVPPRLLQDFRLGPGEAEALALALEKEEDGVVIATDDRNAIRACKVLRIGFVTSLGILTRAVEKGLLAPADGMRILERLKAFGRFRAEIIEEVARQIGGASHGESSEDR